WRHSNPSSSLRRPDRAWPGLPSRYRTHRRTLHCIAGPRSRPRATTRNASWGASLRARSLTHSRERRAAINVRLDIGRARAEDGARKRTSTSSTEGRIMAGARFHFDLSHVSHALPGLRFHAGAHGCAMAAHTEQTRAQALRDNAALALIPEAHRHRITHYADVDEALLPRSSLCRLRVTCDHGDPRFYLRGLVLLAFHIPERVRRRHRERKLAARNEAPLPAKLAHYGVG